MKKKLANVLLKEKEDSSLTYQQIGDVLGMKRQSVRGALTLADEPTLERLLDLSEAMNFKVNIKISKDREKDIILYETKRNKGKLRK